MNGLARALANGYTVTVEPADDPDVVYLTLAHDDPACLDHHVTLAVGLVELETFAGGSGMLIDWLCDYSIDTVVEAGLRVLLSDGR